MVAGSIPLRGYFHDLFGRLHLRPGDILPVLSRSGTVIMRTPFDLDFIGKNLSHSPLVIKMMSQPSGSHSSASQIDGVERLYVWRDSSRPLIVLVGKPWSDILGLWRTEATRIGGIMVALILFVLGVTLFLAREISRRAQAEDKLEELATTGRADRAGEKPARKFDTAIEGRVAARGASTGGRWRY